MPKRVLSVAGPAVLAVGLAVGSVPLTRSSGDAVELVSDTERPAAAPDDLDETARAAIYTAAVRAHQYVLFLQAAAAQAAADAAAAQAAADAAAQQRAQQAQQAQPRRRSGGAGGGLASIRQCESGGDYSAVSSGGTYRGAYQFDQQTWESVGGTGDPAAASPAEQDARAAQLQAQRGSSPWPNCG